MENDYAKKQIEDIDVSAYLGEPVSGGPAEPVPIASGKGKDAPRPKASGKGAGTPRAKAGPSRREERTSSAAFPGGEGRTTVVVQKSTLRLLNALKDAYYYSGGKSLTYSTLIVELIDLATESLPPKVRKKYRLLAEDPD